MSAHFDGHFYIIAFFCPTSSPPPPHLSNFRGRYLHTENLLWKWAIAICLLLIGLCRWPYYFSLCFQFLCAFCGPPADWENEPRGPATMCTRKWRNALKHCDRQRESILWRAKIIIYAQPFWYTNRIACFWTHNLKHRECIIMRNDGGETDDYSMNATICWHKVFTDVPCLHFLLRSDATGSVTVLLRESFFFFFSSISLSVLLFLSPPCYSASDFGRRLCCGTFVLQEITLLFKATTHTPSRQNAKISFNKYIH